MPTRREYLTILLQVVLAVALAGVAGSVTWRLASMALAGADAGALSDFTGAFWGAFFAFFFLIVAGFLGRVYERWMVNHRALVELQFILNDAMNRIADNQKLLDDMRDEFARAEKSESAVILANRFISVPANSSVLTQLLHIELINQLYQFFQDVQLLNDHMHAANTSHDNAQKACMGKIIDVPNYNRSLGEFGDGLTEIEERLIQRREDVDRLFATVRCCLRSKPLVARVTGWLSRRRFNKKDEQEIAKILAELPQELEENLGRRERWHKRMQNPK